MKIKFLVGALILLVIVNLAAIGTVIMMRARRLPMPERRGIRAVAPEGELRSRRTRIPREHREELMVQLHDLQQETEPFRERIADLEGQMFETLHAEQASEAVIDSLLSEISNVQFEMSKVATRKLIEAKEILPPEHWEMFFRAMLNARRGRMGMMGPRGDGRSGGRRGRRMNPDSLSR